MGGGEALAPILRDSCGRQRLGVAAVLELARLFRAGAHRARGCLLGPDTPHGARLVWAIQVFLLDLFP